MAIVRFSGYHQFLSNFYIATVYLDGESYPSVEHAYQAAKTIIPEEREIFRSPEFSPSQAKKQGKKITLRNDWDKVKLEVMEDLVRQKFQEYDLARLLKQTGDEELVEGNYWGDTFWGQCPVGEGFNHLGRILMKVRDELA